MLVIRTNACSVSITFAPPNKIGRLPIPKHLVTLPTSSTPPAAPESLLYLLTAISPPFLGAPTESPPQVPLAPPCSFPTRCPDSWAGGSARCGQPGAMPLLSGWPGHTCQLATNSYSADVKTEFFVPFLQQEH